MLTIGTIAYLACLPLGWNAYRLNVRRDAAAARAATAAAAPGEPYQPSPPIADEDRPTRLN